MTQEERGARRDPPGPRRFAGGVLPWILGRLREGPLHLTLLDPEKLSGTAAARLAQEAARRGSDGILLGGSTGIGPSLMDETARAIRGSVSCPVVVFPQGPESLTREADALFFMSLLNSRDLDFVIRTQARSALWVRRSGLEPIPVGYLVVAPGMRVGEVGRADLLPRSDPERACGYALAAQYLGMRLVYLEAGSGAPDPVPPDLVRAVAGVLEIPLIVGGGIRTAGDAKKLLEAGANILVTGTLVEQGGLEVLAQILGEVRKHRGERPPP
jgi:phosphoglycerol geranylgeranyltransferase